MFDDDLWDFTDVVGLPVQMSRVSRRFDFTAIADHRWRLVAKELILAMLAPRHNAVAVLPRAYRTPLHLRTANSGWRSSPGSSPGSPTAAVTSLAAVTDTDCEDYLAHRRYVLDNDGHVVGERQPATRRAAAQVIVDLINYRELFSSDRVTATLRPWGGAKPSAVAEMPCGTGQNKTPPLEDAVLQPMLAAATYLVDVIGPHTIELARQVADADQKWSIRHGDHAPHRRLPITEFTHLLAGYEHRREPLPLLADHMIRRRIAHGWSPEDPLTPIALGSPGATGRFHAVHDGMAAALARPNRGHARRCRRGKTLRSQRRCSRTTNNSEQTAWTVPLDREQAVAVIGIVRTAAIALLAALSGMRSSELMELKVGCCCSPERYGPDLARYRLASRVIKGQQLGGVPDEWVVIEPAYRAAQLLEQLHEHPAPGAPLLGRFAFDVRCTWLRNWVNGAAGQRLGLAPIPDTPVSLRALRRTLAIELAYRPGGMLAAKMAPQAHRRRHHGRVCLHDPAALKPSCWPRSTSTKPTATWSSSGPSSATTSKASCPPGPQLGN